MLERLVQHTMTIGQTFELEQQNSHWLQQVNYMHKRAERDKTDNLAPQEERNFTLGFLKTLSHNTRFLECKARKLPAREIGLKRTIGRNRSPC